MSKSEKDTALVPVPQSEKYPNLEAKWEDATASLAKAGVSLVPYVGSFLSELVGEKIKNQRFERLVEYVVLLRKNLEALSSSAKAEPLDEDADSIELFEIGAEQATRAKSSERRERIARLVANGMTGGEKDRLEAKRLLQLFAEVDDIQVIILLSEVKHEDEDFFKKHEDIIYGPNAYIGSSQDEIDQSTISDLARNQLQRLGLMKPRFSSIKKGDIPEFDRDTGTIKASGSEITSLGRLLLRRLGLLDEDF